LKQSATEPLTVTLSIGSQPFQMRVAERLRRDGMLKRVVAFPRGVEILDDHAFVIGDDRNFLLHQVVHRPLYERVVHADG